MIRQRRSRRLRFAATAGVVTFVLGLAPAAGVPAAPRPTSTATSPQAPDPHPQRGGIGPDGRAVGGGRLLSRAVVVPAGAPALPKGLTARAWVLSDLGTGTVLAARDAHGRYPPASILKTLTSLVLLPKLAGNRRITASANAANAEGSAVGLVPGGKYTVDTLFKSLLLMSGNDAATALAEAGGGVRRTVAAMNAEAQRLGAYDTYAQTPSGLDGWQQLSSAYDLSLILRAVAANPRFAAYDRALTARLPAQKVGARKWGPVPLFNQSADFLTGVPGALVAKTGYTDAALHTYMCAAVRGGRRLGVVFLRAQRIPTDLWQQAAALLNWGFARPAGAVPVGQLSGPAAAANSARVTPSPSAAPSSAAPSSAAPPSAAPPDTASPTATARVRAAGPALARIPASRNDHRLGTPVSTVVTVALLMLLAALVTRRTRRTRRKRRGG